MSARFGSGSPSKAKNAKLKILIACMLLLMVLLFGALAYLVQNSKEAPATIVSTEVPGVSQPQPVQQVSGVLLPLFRVEEGAKLSADMFNTEQLPADQVPPNAYPIANKALLAEKYAKRAMSPNVPLLNDDVSDAPPLNAINIPPGFRLITIIVDARSGVEGWAKPGTRVDVLFTFTQNGTKKIAPIAKAVKVVSIAGNAAQNTPDKAAVAGPVTVSLLVTEKQSRSVELARSSGELSLVLVGGKEMPTEDSGPTEIDTIEQILQQDQKTTVVEEVPPDGTMYSTDPATGKQLKYELRKGKWVKAKSE